MLNITTVSNPVTITYRRDDWLFLVDGQMYKFIYESGVYLDVVENEDGTFTMTFDLTPQLAAKINNWADTGTYVVAY